MKNSKDLEKHFKGVANHRRIDILILVYQNPGITVDGISEKLDCNFKTISEHIKKMTQAGLVDKKHKGRTIAHSVSPYGKEFFNFMKSF